VDVAGGKVNMRTKRQQLFIGAVSDEWAFDAVSAATVDGTY
jgi:hypothetical protein